MYLTTSVAMYGHQTDLSRALRVGRPVHLPRIVAVATDECWGSDGAGPDEFHLSTCRGLGIERKESSYTLPSMAHKGLSPPRPGPVPRSDGSETRVASTWADLVEAFLLMIS